MVIGVVDKTKTTVGDVGSEQKKTKKTLGLKRECKKVQRKKVKKKRTIKLK